MSKKAIISEMREKGLKVYILQKSDIGRIIDYDTFGRATASDIGRKLVLQSFGLQMESIEQMNKRLGK